MEALHVTEGGLKLVVENLHYFVLGEADKTEVDVCNFGGNLTYNIVLVPPVFP